MSLKGILTSASLQRELKEQIKGRGICGDINLNKVALCRQPTAERFLLLQFLLQRSLYKHSIGHKIAQNLSGVRNLDRGLQLPAPKHCRFMLWRQEENISVGSWVTNYRTDLSRKLMHKIDKDKLSRISCRVLV